MKKFYTLLLLLLTSLIGGGKNLCADIHRVGCAE